MKIALFYTVYWLLVHHKLLNFVFGLSRKGLKFNFEIWDLIDTPVHVYGSKNIFWELKNLNAIPKQV